jgi:hypothetical protein
MKVFRVSLAVLAFVSALTGCQAPAAESAAAQRDARRLIDGVLDALHERASAADGDGYFALYRQGAVFLGTDRDEYWPLPDFERYARKRFDAGQGWTYDSTERIVHLFENTAWFEERLQHARYGETRGTGVLVREQGVWRIAQYNLALPIPNAIFDQVTSDIDQHYRRQRR